MISQGRLRHDFTVFSVFCGFELGLALACLATGSFVLCLPLIFGSLIGCWAVISPNATVTKISCAVHGISTLLLVAIAAYGYWNEDVPTATLTYPNFWLFVLGVIISAGSVISSRAVYNSLVRSNAEDTNWQTPCHLEQQSQNRSPRALLASGEANNYECVLQIPDSMFVSEQVTEGTRTVGVSVSIGRDSHHEPQSMTPEIRSPRSIIKLPLPSSGRAASEYQSCKSNTVAGATGAAEGARRYSHGEQPRSPVRQGHSMIEKYFTQHLSPRPVWIQMPSRVDAYEPQSERGPPRSQVA